MADSQANRQTSQMQLAAIAQKGPDQNHCMEIFQQRLLTNSQMFWIAHTTATTDSDDDARISDWKPPTAHTENSTNHAHPQDMVAAATTKAQYHQQRRWGEADLATGRSS